MHPAWPCGGFWTISSCLISVWAPWKKKDFLHEKCLGELGALWGDNFYTGTQNGSKHKIWHEKILIRTLELRPCLQSQHQDWKFCVRVLATSPPKNLENFRKEKNSKIKRNSNPWPPFQQPQPYSLLSQPSSPLLDADFCQIYTPYHYNTNLLSPTVAKTQTPRHQPITETQTPTTSLTSRLALSIDYNIII